MEGRSALVKFGGALWGCVRTERGVQGGWERGDLKLARGDLKLANGAF